MAQKVLSHHATLSKLLPLLFPHRRRQGLRGSMEREGTGVGDRCGQQGGQWRLWGSHSEGKVRSLDSLSFCLGGAEAGCLTPGCLNAPGEVPGQCRCRGKTQLRWDRRALNPSEALTALSASVSTSGPLAP